MAKSTKSEDTSAAGGSVEDVAAAVQKLSRAVEMLAKKDGNEEAAKRARSARSNLKAFR